MSKKNIWSYLKLDSYNGIEIPFSKSRTEIIDILQKNKISLNTPTQKQIIIKSKIFPIEIDFYISFLFDEEKLIAVSISPDTFMEGEALYFRYKIIQNALESELGHPHNYLRKFINLLDPSNSLSYWQINGVKIEHYLLNRFGLEEYIKIEL